MRVSVLINCHNYEAYVGEAIDSVRRQSAPVDELIIVDDGSTDRSARVIEQSIAGMPGARLIRQANRGQLAAFDTGVREATGDILFFLDADDRYLEDHVAEALEVFQKNSRLGFYFCAYRNSDSNENIRYKQGSGDLGPSAILTYLINAYTGSITSATVIRREIAEALFPPPDWLFEDWITEADNYVVFGASLTGFSKHFNPKPGFVRRVHANNLFHGRKRGFHERYRFHLRRHRMLNALFAKFHFSPDIARKLHTEFRAVPNPSRAVYRDYCKAIRCSSLRWNERFVIRLKLFGRFYLRRS